MGDIADRDCRVVDVNWTEEVAVYSLNGAYYAIEDCCNHDGGDISGGWVEDDVAVCPRHLARFSIRTGAVLAGPAYESVHSFPTQMHAGEIQVCDDCNWAPCAHRQLHKRTGQHAALHYVDTNS